MGNEQVKEVLKEVAPSMGQIARTAENALIRRAIWSLPPWAIWVGVVCVLLLSYFFGSK